MVATASIGVESLAKAYKDVEALKDISFDVPAGTIFGFLGQNGAGKSTTIRILTTLGLPTSGQALVGGYDVVTQPGEVRRIAGVALQDIGLDPLMKPLELLTLQARLFGASKGGAQARALELLELVRLEGVTDRRVGTFSGGMRRRLDLAMALTHEPQILFLDEPTTGLDPASRRDVWGEVRRLNRQLGMTIFLTTQYLEEADELADVVAIIDDGEIIAQGKPAELKASMGNESINLTFDDVAQAERAALVLQGIGDSVQADHNVLRLYLPRAADSVLTVVRRLEKTDLQPRSLTLAQPSLDDVFLRVTGQTMPAAQTARAA